MVGTWIFQSYVNATTSTEWRHLNTSYDMYNNINGSVISDRFADGLIGAPKAGVCCFWGKHR